MEEKKILTCECGFSITSPYGEENLLKHGKIHAQDKHPEWEVTEEELREMIQPA